MWGITKIVKPPDIKVLLQRLSAAVAAHDGFAAVEGDAMTVDARSRAEVVFATQEGANR